MLFKIGKSNFYRKTRYNGKYRNLVMLYSIGLARVKSLYKLKSGKVNEQIHQYSEVFT